MIVAVCPGHEPDSEEDGVDSACGGELDRFIVDTRGPLASAVKRNIIANEVSQKRWRTGKESGEPTGMTSAQFDCDIAGKMQKRVRSTKF